MTGIYSEQDIKEANSVGLAAGQIAMGEYILTQYSSSISPELERFIRKAIAQEYDKMEVITGRPAEDIATSILNLMPK